MNVACSIDNNYVEHCSVMLTSLFECNPGEQITIHLLTEGLLPQNRAAIERIVDSYDGNFCYYLVNSDSLKNYPIKAIDHLSIATYYRLFMAEILPTEIEKVLYLDCDIVILKPIKELWCTDLTGCAVAAVEEMGCSRPDVYERLNYDPKYGYFNAGVLLINLDYWRKNRVVTLFFEYLAAHSDRIVAHDQDLLNVLFHDKYRPVCYKWNLEEAFYHYTVRKRMGHNAMLRQVLRSPSILHYTWKPKPWDRDCRHPLRIEYFRYLAMCPGGQRLSLGRRLGQLADKWLFCTLLFFNVRGRRFSRLK